MNIEINEILLKIKNIKYTEKYIEFHLNKPININCKETKQLIRNLNYKINTKAYYNPVTLVCDSIGVIDVDDTRIIDFDDSNFTLLNKGIYCQTDKI